MSYLQRLNEIHAAIFQQVKAPGEESVAITALQREVEPGDWIYITVFK